MTTKPLRISAFRSRDGSAVRALVLDGLAERLGRLDERRNADLDDVAASFASGYFACAWLGDGPAAELVGVGGFRPARAADVRLVARPGDGDVARVERMSVASHVRRRRIGTAVLEHLVEAARARGHARVVLETTDGWHDAIAFYERRGFRRFGHRDGDVWLVRDLGEAAP